MNETSHHCHGDPHHCDTQERLLDAAEYLFATQGIAETSLRAITAKANANLASVNYHFGSKEALFQAVIARRLGPINDERLRLLAAAEADAGEVPPTLEAVIETFVRPIIRLRHDPTRGGEYFMRLMGRVHAEPGEWTLRALEEFRESFQRFAEVFARILPDLSEEERLWRMFFLIGVTAHTAAADFKLKHFAGDRCPPTDIETTSRRLVAFAVAGFRAPVPSEDGDNS
jgi:AcrR family transcriptional regulator